MTTSGLISALDVYDGALAAHLAGLPPGPLLARVADRAFTQLALQRWCAAVDCADRAALDRLRMTLPGGAGVLDLGCGPGRHAAYLHNAGLCVLGVDTSAPAVALTRRAGAAALLADALGPLPRPAAGWDGVLLLDGNVGIGGDPHRLLSQVVDLLPPGAGCWSSSTRTASPTASGCSSATANGSAPLSGGPGSQPPTSRVPPPALGWASPMFGRRTVGSSR